MDSTKLVLGVLAGVAVGATLGILFAPDKGSETRRKLAGKGGEYADLLEEKFNDLMDTVTAKMDEIKEEASGLAAQGEQKAEHEINRAASSVAQIQNGGPAK